VRFEALLKAWAPLPAETFGRDVQLLAVVDELVDDLSVALGLSL
jgi:hypothetical protein